MTARGFDWFYPEIRRDEMGVATPISALSI